jgi:hypothetical protein
MPRSRQKGGLVPNGLVVRRRRQDRPRRFPMRQVSPGLNRLRALNEVTLDPYSRWWIDHTTGDYYEDEEGHHVSENEHGHECFGCVHELDSVDHHCSACNRERGFQGGAKKKTRRRRRRKASATRAKRRKRSRRVRRG